jgi:hypothetical protein
MSEPSKRDLSLAVRVLAVLLRQELGWRPLEVLTLTYLNPDETDARSLEALRRVDVWLSAHFAGPYPGDEVR